MWLWGNDSLPSLAEDQWGLPAVQMWCFYLLYDWDIDFQTGHFADFDQFKVDSHSATLGKSKNWPYSFILLTLAHSYFSEFGQNVGLQKTIQNPL